MPIVLNGSTGITTDNLSTDTFDRLSVGMKNKIINGDFDIWQRGTSFTGVNYTADRWFCANAGTTHTTTQQTFSLGQSEVPNNPTYYFRTVVSSVAGSSNYFTLQHRIESVKTLSGKTATLSFWAKANASKNMSIEFVQSFGTGGSPSAVVNGIGVTKLALTTSWQKFTVTVNIPSISGKTLGTNSDDHLQVTFWLDAGTTFNSRTNTLGQQSGTFDISQVQLEEGSVATSFEERHVSQEYMLCQRYYTVVESLIHTSYALANGLVANSFTLPVKMRINPSLFITYSSYSNLYATNLFTANNYNGMSISIGDNAVATGNAYAYFTCKCNAEL